MYLENIQCSDNFHEIPSLTNIGIPNNMPNKIMKKFMLIP